MIESRASHEDSWIDSFPSSEPTAAAAAAVAGNDSSFVRSNVAGEPTSSKVRESPVGADIFGEAPEEAAEDETPPRLVFGFDFELDLPPRLRPLLDLPPM